MGSTNFGSQIKTVGIQSESSAYTFNVRNLDIIPTGVYEGGILTVYSDNYCQISPLVAEIKDSYGIQQVRVQTQVTIELELTETTAPYVIMRWVRGLTPETDYIDFFAGSILDFSVGTYLVLGKGVFVGGVLTSFVYFEQTSGVADWRRSEPHSLPYNSLRIEAVPSNYPQRGVFVHSGYVPNLNGGNIEGFLGVGFQFVSIPTGATANYVLSVNRSVSPTAGFISVLATGFSSTYSLPDASTVVIGELRDIPTSGWIQSSRIRDIRTYIR